MSLLRCLPVTALLPSLLGATAAIAEDAPLPCKVLTAEEWGKVVGSPVTATPGWRIAEWPLANEARRGLRVELPRRPSATGGITRRDDWAGLGFAQIVPNGDTSDKTLEDAIAKCKANIKAASTDQIQTLPFAEIRSGLFAKGWKRAEVKKKSRFGTSARSAVSLRGRE